MKRFLFIISITLGICLMGQISWATRAYVTDSFRISLRRGPSIENKILKFLPSGLPVEVLKEEDGWHYIQPLDPEEENVRGWVLSRYLISRQPWENQFNTLSEESVQLKTKLARVEKELEEVSRGEQEATKELGKNTEALHKLTNEYESLKRGSADYLKLKAEYDTIQRTDKTLREENERFKSSHSRKWFAVGASVLLFGLLIGLALGRQRGKHRSKYL